MSDDQLPDLEIDFSSQDNDDGDLLEVGHDVAPDERVVRVFFPNAGGGGGPEDEAQDEAPVTPPYRPEQPEPSEEHTEAAKEAEIETEAGADESPPTDELPPLFEDADELPSVPEETGDLEGDPTPVPRSLSEVVSDLAADNVEAELAEEPVAEEEPTVEHRSLRPIDDILFMLEEEAEPTSASAAETRPAMRSPQQEAEAALDESAEVADKAEVAAEQGTEVESEAPDPSPAVKPDDAFELPPFEPAAELQYSTELQYSEEEELEPESHRQGQKKRGENRQERRVKVGVLAVLIIGLLLVVVGGIALWTLFQNQADALVGGLFQGNETPLPTQTVEGALLEPTTASTATEVRPSVTPFPTTTSVPDDEAAGAATAEPVPTQAPITVEQEIISNSEGILLNGTQMIYVAGGSFTMGDGVANLAHTVTLNPFYIDKFEVTNARWETCVEAGACSEPASTLAYDGNPYYGEADYADYPVIFVDWHNADAFCNWLGARLPTEAEWEMAARYDAQAEGVSAYPWGDEWEPVANICDTNCPLPGRIPDIDDGYAQTAPVGSYTDGASPAGVYDMAGNVAEWVTDWYSSGYYATSPEADPTGPATGTLKVVRGGAWGVSTQGVLSTARSSFQPWVSGPGLGLRCALPASAVNP